MLKQREEDARIEFETAKASYDFLCEQLNVPGLCQPLEGMLEALYAYTKALRKQEAAKQAYSDALLRDSFPDTETHRRKKSQKGH